MDDVALNQSYAHLLARFLVRPLVGTPVTPNQLTGLRLILGLAACGLLAVGGITASWWSGSLWITTCLLDRADGELARLADLRSERGKVLDFYFDLILDAGWFLAAGVGLRHGVLGVSAILVGLLTCASVIVGIGFAELFDRASPPGVKAWAGTQRFHPDDALFLLAPITWLGWLAPVLIVAGVCTPMIALVMYGRYASQKRRASSG